MTTISIITPVLDHPEFALEYADTVVGADEVIIVDTGSTPANRKLWMEVGKLIDYPTKGHNYGHWCNAGYAHATGDVIVFLNNDVMARGPWLDLLAEDVQDGALYGPELQAQFVGGVKVPFISGWCIAATRATWDGLSDTRSVVKELPSGGGVVYSVSRGPWDTNAYPAAGYWEDNDLSFRAVMDGIALHQTKWPIQHLDGGNGTSKTKRDYYADVETNRATFARMVREALHAAV